MNTKRTSPLWLGVVYAAIASSIINVIVLYVVRPNLHLLTAFSPLTIGPVIGWSVIGTIGAAIVFALVRKYSAKPEKLFATIAIIVLIASFIPDVLIKSVTTGPFAGATWGAVELLMLMHVIVFGIVIYVFLNLVEYKSGAVR